MQSITPVLLVVTPCTQSVHVWSCRGDNICISISTLLVTNSGRPKMRGTGTAAELILAKDLCKSYVESSTVPFTPTRFKTDLWFLLLGHNFWLDCPTSAFLIIYLKQYYAGIPHLVMLNLNTSFQKSNRPSIRYLLCKLTHPCLVINFPMLMHKNETISILACTDEVAIGKTV